MKRYKKDVEALKNICENYLFFVQGCGNENATSDRMLEVLLDKAMKIKQKYDKDGQK
jgi:hypothetical protein